MNVEKLLVLVNNANESINELVACSYFSGNEPYVQHTKAVLARLVDELQTKSGSLSVNLLMELSGLGVLSFKCFENTKLEDDIIAIIEVLVKHIPEFKRLPPKFGF